LRTANKKILEKIRNEKELSEETEKELAEAIKKAI